MSFPACPKPEQAFLFCDMWSQDAKFLPMIQHYYNIAPRCHNLLKLKHIQCSLRKPLKQLNMDKYGDIHAQQARAREDLT